MNTRPDRWALIRTDFNNTVVWNMPGAVQTAMVTIEDSLRAIWPLSLSGIAKQDVNNYSSAEMSLSIDPNQGLCSHLGCFWYIRTTPEYLEKAFPELKLWRQLHIFPKGTLDSEGLVARVRDHLPTPPADGPMNHGVSGGEIQLRGKLTRRGLQMTLSDKTVSPTASAGIYLKEVDVVPLLEMIRREDLSDSMELAMPAVKAEPQLDTPHLAELLEEVLRDTVDRPICPDEPSLDSGLRDRIRETLRLSRLQQSMEDIATFKHSDGT